MPDANVNVLRLVEKSMCKVAVAAFAVNWLGLKKR